MGPNHPRLLECAVPVAPELAEPERVSLAATGVLVWLPRSVQPARDVTEPRPTNGASSRGGAWLRLALFLALALLGPLSVVSWSRSFPTPPPRAFDDRPLRRIRARDPTWVFIGNSMVNTRLSESTLNRLLSPNKAVVLGVSGSKSAVWYLTFKNQVIPASRPRRVFVFFYGDELTAPRARTFGAERFQVARVSRGEEPVVALKLAPSWRQPVARIGWSLSNFAPLGRIRALADEPLDDFANRVSELVSPGPGRDTRKEEINELFALGNLRSAPAAPDSISNSTLLDTDHDFESLVAESFLPEMLELAANARIPLTFVRIRTRELAQGGQLPKEEQVYLQNIERYLKAHGARYVNMANAEWEHIGLYGEGSHIARRHTRTYTRLFVQHMSALFEQ